jgi:hypothetical protein
MRTFFWGYFSKPWKRLLRTISVIIILPILIIFPNLYTDFDLIFFTSIILLIPILSYVIEPFVLKNSKTNNENKIDTSKISDQSELKTKWVDIKLNKKITIPVWLSFSNEYIKGTTYFLRMIIGVMTIWILGFGLYLMIITSYKRSKSLGLNKRKSIVFSILIPILLIISSVIKIIELSTNNYIENIDRYYIYLGIIYLLLVPHFIFIFKNGNKVLFETISTREKGKQFLDELEKKGPNTDSVGKIVVNINSTMDDYDEPLSESRKLRNLKNEITKEFPKND